LIFDVSAAFGCAVIGDAGGGSGALTASILAVPPPQQKADGADLAVAVLAALRKATVATALAMVCAGSSL